MNLHKVPLSCHSRLLWQFVSNMLGCMFMIKPSSHFESALHAQISRSSNKSETPARVERA